MPQRSGYMSLPTTLTHSALAKIMTPVNSTPEGGDHTSAALCCPLERFLGSAQLKRHLFKILTSDIKDKVNESMSIYRIGEVMQ